MEVWRKEMKEQRSRDMRMAQNLSKNPPLDGSVWRAKAAKRSDHTIVRHHRSSFYMYTSACDSSSSSSARVISSIVFNGSAFLWVACVAPAGRAADCVGAEAAG
jgi:hypothetical protein